MQGSYMTKEQRIILADQVRKSHFTLGKYSAEYTTTSSCAYLPNKPTVQNNSLLMREQMLKSHFKMGTDTKAIKTQSETLSRYKQHEIPTQSLFDNKLKQELISHHFKLGRDSPQFTSTSNEAYSPIASTQDSTKQITQRNMNLDKNNFKLGTDHLDLKTIAKSQFTHKQAGNEQHLIAEQIKIDRRKCHFKMGNHESKYETTAKEDFTPKNISSSIASTEHKNYIQNSHFVLGTQSSPKISLSHLAYKNNGQAKELFNKELLNDVRTAHFTLGNSPIDYKSASHANYTRAASSPNSTPLKSSTSFRKTNFVIGNISPSWKSSYSSSHRNQEISLVKSNRDRSVDCSSNLKLGNARIEYRSVSSESFQKTKPIPNQLDSKQINKLRNHNFVLGISEPKFETTYSITSKAKQMAEVPTKILTTDKTKVSLVLGSDQLSYGSANKLDYQGSSSSPSQLNPALLKDHRSTHFQLGIGKKDFSTIYTANYGWVKPVPLESVKFSME